MKKGKLSGTAEADQLLCDHIGQQPQILIRHIADAHHGGIAVVLGMLISIRKPFGE